MREGMREREREGEIEIDISNFIILYFSFAV